MELYCPWKNRSGGMPKITKEKHTRRKIWRRAPKRIWYFGLVWEAEIYSRMAGKYQRTPMEILTWDNIDISDWTEFGDNQTDNTEGNVGIWIGVSH